MNSKKIVDAIGMLDDKMITDAREPKINRFSTAVKVVAAVLAVLLIPTVVIFGGGQLLGRLGADAADPKYRYAFTQEALMGICKQTMYSKSADDGLMCISANPPEICYADSEKVIFITFEGIYVYNYKEECLEYTVSLDEIGVPYFSQGDRSTYISISESGDYALLTSSENMSSVDRILEYRILNLKNCDIDVPGENETHNFNAFKTEANYYRNANNTLGIFEPDDFVSDRMARFENTDFFVMIDTDETEGALIGFAELVIVNTDGSFTTQRIFDEVSENFAQ